MNKFSMIESMTENHQRFTNYINQLTEQETLDPYTAQMFVYRAEMYILGKYPFLIDINTK